VSVLNAHLTKELSTINRINNIMRSNGLPTLSIDQIAHKRPPKIESRKTNSNKITNVNIECRIIKPCYLSLSLSFYTISMNLI
jgi:hypothetical protein